jgi:hypothetical protein
VYYSSAAQFSGSMNGWKAQNLKKGFFKEGAI